MDYISLNPKYDLVGMYPPVKKLIAIGDLHGDLRVTIQSLQLAETRPEEELYDLSSDPWEIHNLASDPSHKQRLSQMRGILANWEIESDDRGRFPEPEEMYDSDMDLYSAKARKKPEQAAVLKDNITLMKRWRAEGK